MVMMMMMMMMMVIKITMMMKMTMTALYLEPFPPSSPTSPPGLDTSSFSLLSTTMRLIEVINE